MFYEEKVVDGTLCFRTTPDGEWFSLKKHVLTERLLAAQSELSSLRGRLEGVERDAERYRRLRENWIDCGELAFHGRLAAIDAKWTTLPPHSHANRRENGERY